MVPPGRSWLSEIQGQLDRIKSAAVFVGRSGFGPWHEKEANALIHNLVNSGRPCIPVILEDCEDPPELPLFLRDVQWVDFRKGDPDPLAKLIWGITGLRPL